MILLNFGHPLSTGTLAALEKLSGTTVSEVRTFKVQFDHETSFAEQVVGLVDQVGLSSDAWQTTPLLINPPSHALIALALLAELHGRMGYFPAVIRLKPVAGSTPPAFALAEVLNLQAIRDTARQNRT